MTNKITINNKMYNVGDNVLVDVWNQHDNISSCTIEKIDNCDNTIMVRRGAGTLWIYPNWIVNHVNEYEVDII